MESKSLAVTVVGILIGVWLCRWQDYTVVTAQVRQVGPSSWAWVASGTAQAVVDLRYRETPWTALGKRVPLNTASIEGLQQVNGIGPSRAAAITEYVAINGHFQTVSELVNVKGIGPKTVHRVAPFVCINTN